MERIFMLNEPNAPRINPALAKEIGLNESLMLLQIEYWISISDNQHDGRKWTYQSIRDIREKTFTFWSTSTINRTLKNLIDMGFIIEGNYNKHKYDKTRWFALNISNLSKLKSILVPSNQNDTRSNQNDTRSNQNDTRSNQNGTTIPKITTKNTTENSTEDINNCANEQNGVEAPNGVTAIDAQSNFEQFWSAYPKKRSKGQAEKSWGKIKPNKQLFEKIMQSLDKAKASKEWTKDGGQFIPYPATWLNAKGWEDEYSPSSKVDKQFTHEHSSNDLDEAIKRKTMASYGMANGGVSSEST